MASDAPTTITPAPLPADAERLHRERLARAILLLYGVATWADMPDDGLREFGRRIGGRVRRLDRRLRELAPIMEDDK
jgi:hypothetical protein